MRSHASYVESEIAILLAILLSKIVSHIREDIIRLERPSLVKSTRLGVVTVQQYLPVC